MKYDIQEWEDLGPAVVGEGFAVFIREGRTVMIKDRLRFVATSEEILSLGDVSDDTFVVYEHLSDKDKEIIDELIIRARAVNIMMR